MGNDFEHCEGVDFTPDADNWSHYLPSTEWMWETVKIDGAWIKPKLENTGNFKNSLPYRPKLERMYMAIQVPGLPRN